MILFSHRFSTENYRIIIADFKLVWVMENTDNIYSSEIRRLIRDNISSVETIIGKLKSSYYFIISNKN